MPQNRVAGGRSTFTVKNERDFDVTVVGVFSAESAINRGIRRFDSEAAKRLLSDARGKMPGTTAGQPMGDPDANLIRSPVAVKRGASVKLDVQFPGCAENWDALIALTRPGSDVPVLRLVETQFYRDPSAPTGSHHVMGTLALQAKPQAPQARPIVSSARGKSMSTMSESVIRRIVRQILEGRDISSLLKRAQEAPPSPVLRSPKDLAPNKDFSLPLAPGTGRIKVMPKITEYEYGIEGDRPGEVKTLRGSIEHQIEWDKNLYAHNRINSIFLNNRVLRHESVKADSEGNVNVGQQSQREREETNAARERELDKQQEAEMAERDRQIAAGEIKVSRKSRARARARHERRQAIALGQVPPALDDDGPDGD
jgi:hypothetical protein